MMYGNNIKKMNSPYSREKTYTGGTFGSFDQDECLAYFLNNLREKDPKERRKIQKIAGKIMNRMNKDFRLLMDIKGIAHYSENFNRVYELLVKDLENLINSKKFTSYLKTRLFACLNVRFREYKKWHDKRIPELKKDNSDI